jgi:hypothetical protein
MAPEPAPRRRRPVRGRAAALTAALLAVVALAGCHPDPTGGARPPAVTASVPAFSTSAWPATQASLPSSWRPGCPVSWQDLSFVSVAYWGYDGARHTGRLVVRDSAVAGIQGVFRHLYSVRFQIRRIHPVDVYGGSDARSMAANNTSAFNCRYVAGTTRWSEHAYGLAIDINPIQNPYVKGTSVDPPEGRPWADRSHKVPGMIVRGGHTWNAFAYIGWEWGGDWRTAKDYQHFSQSGR